MNDCLCNNNNEADDLRNEEDPIYRMRESHVVEVLKHIR